MGLFAAVSLQAFPSGQFGGQEFEDAAQIKEFTAGMGVTFPLTEKTSVNGDGAHPVFAWLKTAGPSVSARASSCDEAPTPPLVRESFPVATLASVVRTRALSLTPSSGTSASSWLLTACP